MANPVWHCLNAIESFHELLRYHCIPVAESPASDVQRQFEVLRIVKVLVRCRRGRNEEIADLFADQRGLAECLAESVTHAKVIRAADQPKRRNAPLRFGNVSGANYTDAMCNLVSYADSASHSAIAVLTGTEGNVGDLSTLILGQIGAVDFASLRAGLRIEWPSDGAPASDSPARRLPYGLAFLEVVPGVSRYVRSVGRTISVSIKHPDQWALLCELLDHDGSITRTQAKALFSTNARRTNARKRLSEKLETLQLMIDDWAIVDLSQTDCD